MSMSVKISLLILAIILFIIGGVRMRTKKEKSITEIVVRSATLIIYSVVMFLANQFLDDDDAIITMLLAFSALVLGYDVYYVHKIRTLKKKLRSLQNKND